jgi:hypothetical protein
MVNRAARAHYVGFEIFRMDVRFHGPRGARNVSMAGLFRKS